MRGQKNSFASKTVNLALLQQRLAKWRFLQPKGREYRYERVVNRSELISTTKERSYFLRSIGTVNTLNFLRSNTKQLSMPPDI